MKRRTLLAGAGIAFLLFGAGCLTDDNSSNGVDDESGDEDSDNDNDGEYVSPDEFERCISISEMDDDPFQSPVEYNVTIIEDTVTLEGTALIRVSATNTSDDKLRAVETPYYKGRSASDDEPGIILHSLEAPDNPSKDYTPNCIEDPQPTQEYYEFTEEGPLTHGDLEPDETGSDKLIVIDDPTVEGCFPPGEYRFENDPRIAFDRETDERSTWGFSIKVSE